MLLRELWLTDFRNYESASLALEDGLTAVVGANGEGKSNLLEAVAYLATLGSFRGAPVDALVRAGQPSAVVRAEGEREGRSLLLEAEISPAGRNRVLVNRQRLRRSRDLLGALRVTVFSPDDLELVKGGPGGRRRFLDEVMVAVAPRRDVLRTELDRVLRQRNTLLRQAGGRLTDEVATTLDVWDAKLAETGDALAAERLTLTSALEPLLSDAYDAVAGQAADVRLRYESSWGDASLGDALRASRDNDLRRGVSTVGPHRDELTASLGGLPVRTHASQGEQRSVALALRLAAHRLVTEASGTAPILLLDDVFSELDPDRSDALVACLPEGQTLLTTAGALPSGIRPERVVRIEGGELR